MMQTPRVAVIGIGGYGAGHLANMARFDAEGRVNLVAVADPKPPVPGTLPQHTRHHTDGVALFETEQVDIAIIATPIHAHFPVAAAAVRSGADVLLEKPTTATLAEFDELSALTAAHDARVQIGFQSLGSAAVEHIRERVAAGDIGDVVRYSAAGTWVRNRAYWNRVRWAGKRTLDGRVVADGVLTNPLAHATATVLALAGQTERDDVTHISMDMHRANDIEADDTSVAIMTLRDGRKLTTAVTLAAVRNDEPYVDVVGASGTLRMFYKNGDVQRLDARGNVMDERAFDAVGLFDNLLEARATGAPLRAPLVQTGAFMRLVDAVMTSAEPRQIDERHITELHDDLGDHLVVAGVEDAVLEALRAERTFTELGVPFAS